MEEDEIPELYISGERYYKYKFKFISGYSNCFCRVPEELKTTYHRFPNHICAISKLINLSNCCKPVRETKIGFRWSYSYETGDRQFEKCLEIEPPTSNGIFAYSPIFWHLSHLSNSNDV